MSRKEVLRASQLALLEAVAWAEAHHPNDRGPGAAPAVVARALNRDRSSVEESLAKLEEAGCVKAIFYPLLSAVYVLTDQGRALTEKGSRDG